MTIGIIGTGRMGLDLFYLLLGYDCKAVLICKDHTKIEKLNRKALKILKRNHKDVELQSPVISTDYHHLSTCDVIIETVIEDLKVKQHIFQTIEALVPETCVFATNSSSLDVSKVFEYIKNKNRCLGLHFFYPIKLLNTVEVNTGTDTSEEVIEKTVEFLHNLDKKPLLLKERSRLLLSKLLISLASYAYELAQAGEFTIREIDGITKQLFLFGIFEMVDSTGFSIISQCLINLPDKQHISLYQPLLKKILALMEQGSNGREGGGFLTIEEWKNPAAKNSEEVSETYTVKFLAFLINETAGYMTDPSLDKNQLGESIQEILGLSASPKELFHELGEEAVRKTLKEEYDRTQDCLWKPADFSVFC